MEKKTIKVYPRDKNMTIRDETLFGWKKDNEQYDGIKISLSFTRDVDDEKRLILRKLEKEYKNLHAIPTFVLIIFAILSFAFITTYLVISFTNKDMDKLISFLSFLLPGLVFTSLLGILAIVKTKQTINYINKKEQRFIDFSKKVQEISNEK